jgi:hypothetical protein
MLSLSNLTTVGIRMGRNIPWFSQQLTASTMTTATARPTSGVTPNELILAVVTATSVEATPAYGPQLRTDFTHFYRMPINLMSVEQLDCFSSFISRRHLDKGKVAQLLRSIIHRLGNGFDVANLAKQLTQLGFARVIRQVAHIQFGVHWSSQGADEPELIHS